MTPPKLIQGIINKVVGQPPRPPQEEPRQHQQIYPPPQEEPRQHQQIYPPPCHVPQTSPLANQPQWTGNMGIPPFQHTHNMCPPPHFHMPPFPPPPHCHLIPPQHLGPPHIHMAHPQTMAPPLVRPQPPPVERPVTPPVGRPVTPPILRPVTPPVVRPVAPPVTVPPAELVPPVVEDDLQSEDGGLDYDDIFADPEYAVDDQPVDEATMIARLLRIAPAAKVLDIKEALRVNDNDFDAAGSWLIDMLTERAAKTREAKNLCMTVFEVFPAQASVQQSTYADWLHDNAAGQTTAVNNALLGQTQAGVHLITPILNNPACIEHSGRRKALLVGVSYAGSRQNLKGPMEDCRRLKQFLHTVWGIPDNPHAFVLLSEAPENLRDTKKNIYLPTKANIFAALEWLAASCEPGDSLFFYYSGHGSQKTAVDGYKYESDGMDETILPMDHKTAGHIRDDDLCRKFARKLPQGARATCLLDCCHSGTGMDLSYHSDLRSGKWKYRKQKYSVKADVCLISGCRSDETSADLTFGMRSDKHGGAMTMALLSALSFKPFTHSFKTLLTAMAKSMRSRGMKQEITLTSSLQFKLSRPFRMDHIIKEHCI